MSSDPIDEICKQLGIPKQVFHGGTQSSLSAEFESRANRRLRHLRDLIGPGIIQPLVEKAMPEMFWEPIFLCSPRGIMLQRRTTVITWESP